MNANNLVMPQKNFNKAIMIDYLEAWEIWYNTLKREINFITKELGFAIELDLEYSIREFKSRLSMAKTELELAEQVIRTYKILLNKK